MAASVPRGFAAAALALALLLSPAAAHAFCGFYVSGANDDLTNNATQVVLMRDGQRTVLSMQNDYQGPPEDFALVIPVPVVLKKENVKTLPPEVFDKVDKMAAPRLVEYWEQDPCKNVGFGFGGLGMSGIGRGGGGMSFGSLGAGSVKVEARFEVEEYEIVILSASDSSGLDTWLRDNHYNIPKGAEPILRPYITQGMFFFVARVNAKKVAFKDGHAVLNPLRFHYDDKEFRLPVRLGLLNAHGPQDLVVHIIARDQRYEVANYPNATIPTNIDVDPSVKGNFGGFYAALFDTTRQKHPRAVITEYAWAANTCDPCPGPTLQPQDFLTLGADALPGQPTSGLVLTRLHARYTADELTEDLVFKQAPPITGGREQLNENGQLEQGATAAEVNNFQGRYAIRHTWQGAIACDKYTRGNWGGLPDAPRPKAIPARDTAYVVKRDAVSLPAVIRSHIPELGLTAATTTRALIQGDRPTPAEPAPAPEPRPVEPPQIDADAGASPAPPTTAAPPAADAPTPAPGRDGCATAPGQPGGTGLTLLALGLGLAALRRH